jgi:hypothetical protein
MACLYALARESSKDEIRYIGISKHDEPFTRFRLHKTRLRQGSELPVYDWMRKYDDVTPILLESNLSWEEACKAEIKAIVHLKSRGARLLNCTGGGEGFIELSDEVRQKLSLTWLGRKHTEEAKKKMSEAKLGKPSWNKGVPMSEESKRKLSESKKGKTLTEEHKQKISTAGKGRTHTEESKAKIGAGHRGKTVLDQTRKKLSNSLKGKTAWNKGLTKSEQEARRKTKK